MHWKIWYINNVEVEGSTPDDWANAPSTGVCAIAAFYGLDEYGRKLGQTWNWSNWYWMVDNTIDQSTESVFVNNAPLPDNLPSGSIVKQGMFPTDDVIQDIHVKVVNWIS